MMTKDNIKPKLISHLKGCYIKGDIDRLWGETKAWFKSKLMDWGGGYASFGKDITVRTKVEGEMVEFKITLKEVE
jgi:hypothetical protein